jgi:hypothetical protein
VSRRFESSKRLVYRLLDGQSSPKKVAQLVLLCEPLILPAASTLTPVPVPSNPYPYPYSPPTPTTHPPSRSSCYPSPAFLVYRHVCPRGPRGRCVGGCGLRSCSRWRLRSGKGCSHMNQLLGRMRPSICRSSNGGICWRE